MFIIYSPRIMRMMFKGHSRFLHDFCVSLSYCFFGFNVILHEKLGICNKNQEIAKNISTEELGNYLKKYYYTETYKKNKSLFRKLIALYDFKKYS